MYGPGLERSSPSAHLERTLVSHASCRPTGKKKTTTTLILTEYLLCAKSLSVCIANLCSHIQSQWPGTTIRPSCLLIAKPNINGVLGFVLWSYSGTQAPSIQFLHQPLGPPCPLTATLHIPGTEGREKWGRSTKENFRAQSWKKHLSLLPSSIGQR